MTQPTTNPANLTLRQLLLSFTFVQLWSSAAAVLVLLVAVFMVGRASNSAESELSARQRELQKSESRIAELSDENRALKKTVDDLTRTIARENACQPISEQLSQTIKLYTDGKKDLIALEVTQEENDIDPKTVKKARDQISALGLEVKRLREEYVTCLAEPIASAKEVDATATSDMSLKGP
jgi:cell division protein FtsL